MAWDDLTDAALQAVRDAFGEPATARLVDEAPVAITVVFDGAYQLLTLEPGVEVASREPLALVRNADLPRVPRLGDELFARGAIWQIVEVMPDGQGGSLLRLEAL